MRILRSEGLVFGRLNFNRVTVGNSRGDPVNCRRKFRLKFSNLTRFALADSTDVYPWHTDVRN